PSSCLAPRDFPLRPTRRSSELVLDYNQTAICCAIQTDKPHRATARQAMLPTGTLALLPLADITDEDKTNPGHWQSIVWTLPRNQDRKSTRLNSSHVSISYAVFC